MGSQLILWGSVVCTGSQSILWGCAPQCQPPIPAAQRGDDAVGAEAVQALLGGHGVLQHVQADGAHQLAVKAAWRHRDLRPVHDGLLGTWGHF